MVKSVSRKSALQSVPDYLFYLKKVYKNVNPPQYNYSAIQTETGQCTGELLIHKSNMQLRPDYNGPSLAIDYIASGPMKNGTGTAMMNFAKNISKKCGCNGYIHLKADSYTYPQAVPHLFYRKMGFTTFNKKCDKKIDKFIKNNKPATCKDIKPMLMFFPKPKSTGIWQKLKTLFFRRNTTNNL